MNLPVVIRDEVWKDIQVANLKFAEEVRQCITKIEKRQFDFGLRVKKLKGVSRIVWEARINRASRLLFTYRESNHSNGQNQKFIAVEAICTEHDDVSHQAKIIGRYWWEVEEIKVLGNLDQEFNKLTNEEREEIHLWETESIEIQAEFTDELLENIKWLILTPEIIKSEEEWQNAIESGADLRLRLTPDESKAIDTYGNILLSGSAGTGKTTVGLYRLARTLQMNPAATCLYVAYNPILVKESEEQFKQLWGSTFENTPLKLDFLTIKDLCLKITKDFGEEFDDHLVDYPQFYQRYIKKPESRQYPPSLLWDEIRSIIKGANLKEQPQSYLLSEKEYQNLGNSRSGVIPAGERHKIYKLAQWYQQYLNHDNLVDEIDLTRAALRITKIEKYNPYTLIVCDEVQDFTEIQLELIIGLIAQGGQILCAGDINQMISPSGFRWEDLTTRLYQKNRQWTKENLPFNFRSTGQLVSLSVKLLKLKIQLLSESQPDEEVPRNITGELARLVEASKDDLKQINLGAADAILVRTEKRKQELNKTLATELIFTIEESKGLEFDTVYLIDFFENSKSLWSTALSSSKQLKERQKPELRLEFNLLYVAITRARRLLNICEAGISDLWKRSEIAESLIPMSVDEAFNQAQSIDSQDWYKRAIYYRDARLLPQALECATKSGDATLGQAIKVKFLLLEQKHDEAAQLLLEINKYLEAAEIFEHIKAWKKAAECWELAGKLSKKNECELKSLEYPAQYEVLDKKLNTIERYEEETKIFTTTKKPFISEPIMPNFRAVIHSPILDIKKDNNSKSHDLKRLNSKLREQKLNDNQNIISNSNSAEFYYNRAIAKSELGDKYGAISDYDLAIKLNPNHAEIYNNRGVAKLDLGDKYGAISDYDSAIKLNPDYAEAYANRGYIKYLMEDNQGAITDCKRAIQINPNCVNAYNNLGLTKSNLGDNQGAIANYNLAIKLDPNYASAYNNRGNAKLKLEDYYGSSVDINKANELFY